MSRGNKIAPSGEPITRLDLNITCYCQKIPGNLHERIVLFSVKYRESYLHPKFKHRVKQLSLACVGRLTLHRGNLEINFAQMIIFSIFSFSGNSMQVEGEEYLGKDVGSRFESIICLFFLLFLLLLVSRYFWIIFSNDNYWSF